MWFWSFFLVIWNPLKIYHGKHSVFYIDYIHLFVSSMCMKETMWLTEVKKTGNQILARFTLLSLLIIHLIGICRVIDIVTCIWTSVFCIAPVCMNLVICCQSKVMGVIVTNNIQVTDCGFEQGLWACVAWTSNIIVNYLNILPFRWLEVCHIVQ